MNLKVITRNVGYALLVSALFMFLSVIVSMLSGNDSALTALLISFVITFTVGIFPFIFVRKTTAISLKDGYLIIALSWVLSFIFGMLPYALWGGPFTLANAWFESVSGFTTTGATILEDIEVLPNSLLFWRTSTHFIGGLGVVVFLLLIIPTASPIRMRLTNMELSSLSKGGYSVRANKTIYVFAYVYIGIAVAAFFAYWAAGMPAFDAICHAFSVCATGGFSPRNLSIGAYDSRLIEFLTMVFMVLASVHFGLLYLACVNRTLKPLNNPVLKFYIGALAVFSVMTGLSLKFQGAYDSLGDAMWNGTFHTISIASTTGFGITDNAGWPLLPNLLVLLIGVMCGCAGSTTGGVKADRMIVLLKAIGCRIRKNLHPSSVYEVRLAGRVLKDDEVYPHVLYIGVYIIVLAVSIVLSLMLGVSEDSAFTNSLSSLSNLGPAIREFGTYGNFNSLPVAAKYLYTIDMFLGRVEIYPLLAVAAMLFERRRG